MRLITTLIIIGFLVFGSWWLWNHNTEVREMVKQYVDTGEVLTLEARYTPEQIVEQNRSKLLQDDQHTLQEPTLKFYPYLLMDVKYVTPEKNTRETTVLWSMTDGEMVLNTDNWDSTHGFSDALEAEANPHDFKIMKALESNRGKLSRQDLLNKLHVESDVLDQWLASAKEKHLIVQKGNDYYLHFQNPKLNVSPQTKISQPLVTKPYNHAIRISKRYSRTEIEKIAKAAFGPDFTIRSSKEVFLPVYNIEVLNPDGSILSTQWNALNGQRIYSRY